jgi:hypothetical protein
LPEQEEEALDYLERSNRYWTQSLELLDAGEPAKASEMAWGSVVGRVEALALRRTESPLGSHRRTRNFVRDIAQSEGIEELYEIFGNAERLHTNFYREFLEEYDVRSGLLYVRTFLEQIDRLLFGS